MKDETPHEKPTPFLAEQLLGMLSGEQRQRVLHELATQEEAALQRLLKLGDSDEAKKRADILSKELAEREAAALQRLLKQRCEK